MDKEPAYDYEEDREKEENDKKWGQKSQKKKQDKLYGQSFMLSPAVSILFFKVDLEE